MVSVGCLSYEYKGTQLDPPLSVPDFELMADYNRPFRLSESDSDITLIFFGYTFCPDVCPLTMTAVKQALVQLEPAQQERVQVIFISADPERDTPEKLSKYVDVFNPNFVGLTDDFEKVLEVMKPFGAYAEKEEVDDSAAGYLVNHTARLYLLDTQKRKILLTYPFGFEPKELSDDLAYLLNEKS
jgi:protein SCO1/2